MIYFLTSAYLFFFFNDPPTTEIYTLSLHDALPILPGPPWAGRRPRVGPARTTRSLRAGRSASRVGDRKSTRLNSSHVAISYAVFCLKKKNKTLGWVVRCKSRFATSILPRLTTRTRT